MTKLERIYTIPLGDAYETVRNKRAPRAMKIIREFVIRHMKADGEKVVLSEKLNQLVWARSIQKPPRRVKVRIVKDDEYIRAYLADEKVEDLKKADTKKEEAKKPETEKDEAKK